MIITDCDQGKIHSFRKAITVSIIAVSVWSSLASAQDYGLNK